MNGASAFFYNMVASAVHAWRRSGGLPPRCSRQRCCAVSPLLACRSWVERVVIGLTLCPWARPVQPSIHFVQTEAPNREGVYLALYDEIQNLASGTPPEVPETTILVAPNAFKDDFLELCATALLKPSICTDLRIRSLLLRAAYTPCAAAMRWSSTLRTFSRRRRSTSRWWASTRTTSLVARTLPTPVTL